MWGESRHAVPGEAIATGVTFAQSRTKRRIGAIRVGGRSSSSDAGPLGSIDPALWWAGVLVSLLLAWGADLFVAFALRRPDLPERRRLRPVWSFWSPRSRSGLCTSSVGFSVAWPSSGSSMVCGCSRSHADAFLILTDARWHCGACPHTRRCAWFLPQRRM